MGGIGRRVEALLGADVSAVSRLGGGDLSAVYLLEVGTDRLIAKQTPLAEAEAAMLRAIAKTGAPVPEVLAADNDVLVMSRCEGSSGAASAWDSLADEVRRMWSAEGEDYGWRQDYAFGPVALPNGRHRCWPAFWAE